ncbi:MAG: M20/M25/M40 family metallo-hydrolase [Deltaproteobacteria bacterium]|nr:M20/M25/M40 family metallo-hydrolase [Deltaproteobacteria bacterium]
MAKNPALKTQIQRLRGAFEDRLARLVEIPSVSMDPTRKADMDRCAEEAASCLREVGATVEVVPTGGYPIVVGKLIRDPALPTVTVYNHLDVQPADPAEWNTPPFKFTRKGSRYFARGSTDDKGPALAALFGAQLAVADNVGLNIQFLWELEEEIGSPNFDRGMAKLTKAGFATDSVVVSDTIWIAAGRPAIAYGLRGLLKFTVRLKTGVKDVHSGTTGGAARNPVGELAQLISECYDARSGRVKIPGFYNDVKRLSASEKASFAKAGFSRKRFAAAHELLSLRFRSDAEVMESLMALPTFEVHGINGGYAGPGIKTIVPHIAEAKLSTRLVPNQKPEKVFALIKRFIKQRCPDAEVIQEGVLEPFLSELGGPHQAAAARAMKSAFGKEPAFTREGGSIGAVLTMQKRLAAPIVFAGLSLPEHGYHAINENFDWQQGGGGMEMFYRYFFELAALGKRGKKVGGRKTSKR